MIHALTPGKTEIIESFPNRKRVSLVLQQLNDTKLKTYPCRLDFMHTSRPVTISAAAQLHLFT